MFKGPSWAQRRERAYRISRKITMDIYFEEFRSLASKFIPQEASKVEKPKFVHEVFYHSQIPLKEDVSAILIFWFSFIGKSEGSNRNGQIVCTFELTSHPVWSLGSIPSKMG